MNREIALKVIDEHADAVNQRDSVVFEEIKPRPIERAIPHGVVKY